MLGAKHVIGTDLDPNAIIATDENMEANGISKERYEVIEGNIIDDPAIKNHVGFEKYDGQIYRIVRKFFYGAQIIRIITTAYHKFIIFFHPQYVFNMINIKPVYNNMV